MDEGTSEYSSRLIQTIEDAMFLAGSEWIKKHIVFYC